MSHPISLAHQQREEPATQVTAGGHPIPPPEPNQPRRQPVTAETRGRLRIEQAKGPIPVRGAPVRRVRARRTR